MSFKLTDFITVTTSGNIGLSATPKSTNANGTSMQINNAGLVWHWQGDGIDSMYISQNMYYDGVSWKRMISGYGSLMRLNGNTGDTLFYQTTTKKRRKKKTKTQFRSRFPSQTTSTPKN